MEEQGQGWITWTELVLDVSWLELERTGGLQMS